MRRRAGIWAVGLVPLLVVAVVLVWRAAGGSGADAVPQDRAGPVLLVAGYGGSTAALDTLAQRLRAAGREVQVLPAVGDNTGDLREQAEALDGAARRAVAAGAPSVDVVGYSAGGVVARVWVADEGGDELARRVVTLGSPHHGTRTAGLAAALAASSCPEACRQLAPGSDLLDDLPDAPDGPVWTSIWTDVDEVVTPPDSARLDGALGIRLQQVCAGSRTAHGDLPRDPLTASLVRLALEAPATGLGAAPGPDRCAALGAP